MSAAIDVAAQGWWAWIAPLSFQVALLALVFAFLERTVLRASPAAVRAAFAWAFFVRLWLPPGLASPVAVAGMFGETSPFAPSAPVARGFELALASTWLAGALVFAVRALAERRGVRRTWLEGSRAAPGAIERAVATLAAGAGMRRVPRVRVAARGPAVVGLIRPTIVLPEGAGLDAARLEHVLLHELAHVARRDAWAALAWSVARVVFWFHPAVHWTARHAATLREIGCDARARRAASDPASYRATLLEHARELVRPRTAAVARFGSTQAEILCRLTAIDRAPRISRAKESATALAVFALLCACVLPLASTRAPAVPDLADLDGCLRKRFAVMAAPAAECPSAPTPDNDSPEE